MSSSLARLALPLMLLAGAPMALAAQTAAGGPKATANPMSDSLEHSRKLTKWFYAGMADSLRQFVPEQDRDKMTSDFLAQRLAQLTARAGTEVSVIEEKFVKRNGDTQYWRTAKFSAMEEPLLFRWAFNKEGQIIGQGMGPLSAAPPIDP